MELSADARILRSLRAVGHLPVAQLAAETRLDAITLAARFAELRAAGFEIEEHPHLGYRLVYSPDRIIADDLMARLGARCALAREILVFEKTKSTSDLAAQLGHGGAAEGAIIFAETQTAGRGRLGRKWESPAREGLWFSLLLRPQLPMHEWTRLTIWAAVAVARGIEDALGHAGPRAQVKWPNDIYLGGKKIVGILTESHASERGAFAVAGIGVNVNQLNFPVELAARASSLRLATGRAQDRAEVAAAIVRRLDESYPQIAHDFRTLLGEAEARSFLRGNRVKLRCGNEEICGIAQGLNEDGALQVRESGGALRTVWSGEATVIAKEAENNP